MIKFDFKIILQNICKIIILSLAIFIKINQVKINCKEYSFKDKHICFPLHHGSAYHIISRLQLSKELKYWASSLKWGGKILQSRKEQYELWRCQF